MPIESESRENFRTKRLPNCNSFPIQLNDNGVKIYSSDSLFSCRFLVVGVLVQKVAASGRS